MAFSIVEASAGPATLAEILKSQCPSAMYLCKVSIKSTFETVHRLDHLAPRYTTSVTTWRKNLVHSACRRHEKVSVPLLLPLGSLTWGFKMTQRTKMRKRYEGCLYRYSVHPQHPGCGSCRPSPR
jgi:hypothetical protein